MLKKQITEIYGESHALLGVHRAYALVDRHLRPEADRVVSVNPQHGWPKKNLMSLRLRNHDTALQKSIGVLANELTKKTPVPLIGWPVPIDEAVIQNIRPLQTATFKELRKRPAQPNVMAARCQARHRSGHDSRRVRRHDIAVRGLRPGHNEASEKCGLDPRSHFRRAMLETPFQGSVEICAGLDARRRVLHAANNCGRADEQRQMRRKSVADQLPERRRGTKIIRPPEQAAIETPLAL